MNAIDTLIAEGIIDALVGACSPGETYHVGSRGAKASNEGDTRDIEEIHRRLAAAAPAGTRVALWMNRSSDGKRAMGEIVVDTGKDTPCIVWPIGETAPPRLDYGTQRSVSFASASERLHVASDPLSLLDLVDVPARASTTALVRQLGYRPAMNFPGELSIAFRAVDLERYDA